MLFSISILLLTLLHSISDNDASVATQLQRERSGHSPNELTDEQIVKIASLSNVNHFEVVLNTILIPRVVGTPNHAFVKKFIIETMKGLGWAVESDPFVENTPLFGQLQFENVIARLNPKARRYLVLACHYDSKYFRENTFVGATDSAVPCAMMMNLAHALSGPLKKTLSKNDLSLKFIFFDGEEAFKEWGPEDSIYGAKHLAAKWEQASFPRGNSDGTSELNRMDVLVLLDLLGAPDPVFYSYFKETENWYRRMMEAERNLARLGQLVQYSVGKRDQYYFQQMSRRGGIEDDHVPFMTRGVPILHVIPVPFPAVWHTQDDNRNAVNMPTVENLNKILRVFVAEYLHLQVPESSNTSPLLFLLPLLTPSRVLLTYA